MQGLVVSFGQILGFTVSGAGSDLGFASSQVGRCCAFGSCGNLSRKQSRKALVVS